MRTIKKRKLISLAGVILVLLVVPNFLPLFYKGLLVEVLIFGLFSLGFDIIFGFTGLLNFGTSVFFGLGSYAALLTVSHLYSNLWLALIVTIIVSALFSLIYGFGVARFKSHYFVAFTLVVSMIFFYLAMALRPITGADEGLSFSVPPLSLGFISLSLHNYTVKYYFVLTICGIVFSLVWKFFKTPYGRAIIAVRENEERALTLGYNPTNLRTVAFTLSGTVSGLAGALYTLSQGFCSAHAFFWIWTARSVWWTLVGGVGTLYGAFVGPLVLVFLEDFLSSWNTDVYLIIMGMIMVLVAMVVPRGIVGTIQHTLARREDKGDGNQDRGFG